MLRSSCWYGSEIIRDIADGMKNEEEAPRKETDLEEGYKNGVELRNEEETPGKQTNQDQGKPNDVIKLKYDKSTTVPPNTVSSYFESDGLPFERENNHISKCQKSLSNELTLKNFITDNFSSWKCGIVLFVVLIVILLAILTQLDPKVKKQFKSLFEDKVFRRPNVTKPVNVVNLLAKE